MLKVSNVLDAKGKNIWSVTSKDTAYKALEVLAEKDIGALIVIDEGKLTGIFSERDYARKVILKGKSSKETTVGELMTKEVYTVTADKTVEECLSLMTATHVRHMPVYENGRLVGIVTIGDIVNAIIHLQKGKISEI